MLEVQKKLEMKMELVLAVDEKVLAMVEEDMNTEKDVKPDLLVAVDKMLEVQKKLELLLAVDESMSEDLLDAVVGVVIEDSYFVC